MATRVNQNGYHYTKVENSWVPTAHIIASQGLGRAIDTTQERVTFADGDRTNLDPSNILVVPKQTSKVKRIESLKKRIAKLQAELDVLESN